MGRTLSLESGRKQTFRAQKSAPWPTTLAKTQYNLRPITLSHEHGCIEQGTRPHGLPG
ncbi:hypothetical protein OF001_U50036 [Pseudomonas sp. OF001]|nr:hypothetical protein OF001_U50036 [Pseudomonas sp. OF001]